MKEKTVGVYCPSYRRSDCIMTQNILNDVTYVVRASEEEAYRNAGVRKLISAPDEEINSMSKVRQWILDNSPEDIIVQVDDDIKQILYRTDIVMEIKDPDVIDMEFLRIAQLLSDLKLGYATITVTPRPYLYQEEFKFNSMGGGIYWYNKECYKAKNDDQADCKEDVDKILQELMLNRIILMPKYLAMYVKTDTNEGGDNINKNSIDGIKAKAAEWEQKYNTDTQALNDKLRKQELDHQMDRYLDSAGIKPGAMYRNFVRSAMEAKEFKFDGNKFVGADDYIKELKENPDYKDAFIVEKPDNDPELNIGTDGPVEPPINAPYFAGPTRSEQEPSKDNVFNFGFTGVRKHD